MANSSRAAQIETLGQADIVRSLFVIACAAALIFAGQPLPY
ncbi:hypothetical protein [Pseudoblastomonas halimionae]|nr:hypothetical protein [Alteriqipengyuania halimionae]